MPSAGRGDQPRKQRRAPAMAVRRTLRKGGRSASTVGVEGRELGGGQQSGRSSGPPRALHERKIGFRASVSDLRRWHGRHPSAHGVRQVPIQYSTWELGMWQQQTTTVPEATERACSRLWLRLHSHIHRGTHTGLWYASKRRQGGATVLAPPLVDKTARADKSVG